MRTAKILLLLTAFAGSAMAQVTCDPGQLHAKAEIKRLTTSIDQMAKAAQDKLKPKLEAEADKAPGPAARQLTAPSGSGAGASMVDHASFPALLGAALDQGLISTGNGTETLSLNFFAILALFDHEVMEDQDQYAKHYFLRRFSGAITGGGTALGFDRSGNTVASPQSTTNARDILDGELHLRFYGSRDRRDKATYDVMLAATKEARDKLLTMSSNLTADLATDQEVQRAITTGNDCVDAAVIQRIEARHEAQIQSALSDLTTKIQAAAEQADRSLVLNFVVGRSDRAPQFGLSSNRAGVHADYGTTDTKVTTANLDWTRYQALTTGVSPTVIKVAAQRTYLWNPGKRFADGIDVSGSASWESDRDLPSAMHPTNVKANVMLEFPISKSAKVPISISWADHRDLLTGEKNIRGHIGFTFDFSKLGKPAVSI